MQSSSLWGRETIGCRSNKSRLNVLGWPINVTVVGSVVTHKKTTALVMLLYREAVWDDANRFSIYYDQLLVPVLSIRTMDGPFKWPYAWKIWPPSPANSIKPGHCRTARPPNPTCIWLFIYFKKKIRRRRRKIPREANRDVTGHFRRRKNEEWIKDR